MLPHLGGAYNFALRNAMTARIVQLTDLHLTAADGGTTWGSDVWQNLRAVLAHVRAHEEPFELLVLSGDLANERRPATYARLRELLAPCWPRLRVLPGNHDSRTLLAAQFGELLRPDRRTASFALDLAGWRILGLDSVRRPFVHGKFGREQLGWLRGELRAAHGPVLAFAHHPPIRVGSWWLDKDRPRDRRRLAAIVAGSRLRGIACGHVHQAQAGEFAGVPVWTAPSTAFQFRPRSLLPGPAERTPAYRVFELDGDRLSTRIVRL